MFSQKYLLTKITLKFKKTIGMFRVKIIDKIYILPARLS